MTVNPQRAQSRDVAQCRAISFGLPSPRQFRSATRALLACAVAATWTASARADEYWVGTSGNWDASLWNTYNGSPNLPPPNSGNASIDFNDALTRLVTFDHAGAGPSLGTLTIYNSGGGLSILAQTQGTMTASSLSIGAIAGRGEYDLYGGTLSAGGATVVGGTFNQAGGAAAFGSLSVNGYWSPSTYVMSSGGATLNVSNALTVGNGTFSQGGGSVHAGSVSLSGRSDTARASYSIGPGGTLAVDGAIQLSNANYTQTGGSVTAAGFTSNGIEPPISITMSGGTLLAPGTSRFDYGATILQTGGTFHVGGLTAPSYTLSGTGTLIVDGDLTVAYDPPVGFGAFTQSSGTTSVAGQVVVDGSMTFTGGTFTAAGPLTAHNRGLHTATVINQAGGSVKVAALALGSDYLWNDITYLLAGGTLTATNGASTIGNTGADSPMSFLQSGGIFTAGSLVVVAGGQGLGTYRLDGGSLRLSGDLTLRQNALYAQTAGNATIGGAFVNDATYFQGQAIQPGSSLSLGTLTAGSFENHGRFTFSGGTLNAPVSNVYPTGVTFLPFPPTLVLTGVGIRTLSTLYNDAVVSAESTSVQFTGNVTNNATYVSSASTNAFVTLTNGPAAYLQSDQYSRFRFTGDLLSSSTNAANWQTNASALEFVTNGSSNSHTLSVTGADVGGGNLNGYVNNFAWGALQLDAGQSLVLQDGNAAPGGALYADAVTLADGLSQINAITGNGLDIYYNASNPLNAYLGGLTYPLANGGFLIADVTGLSTVPEPAALTSVLAFSASACLRRRRRRRRPEGSRCR